MENKDDNKTNSGLTIDADGNMNLTNIVKEPTDAEKEELKGPVKQVKEMHYHAFQKNGKVYMGGSTDLYDRNDKTMITYNELGIKIYSENIYTDTLHKYFYNEKGKEVESYTYKNNEEWDTKMVNVYDEAGNLKEQRIYNNQGETSSYHTREYDDRENVTNLTNYDKDDKIVSITIWVYGEFKQFLECIHKNAKGEVTIWSKYTVNEKGHTLTITDYETDGTVKRFLSFENKYDKNGEWIKTTSAKDVYEENVYVIKEQKDHHENWIQKIHYYENLPISIFLRDISYYGEPNPKDYTGKEAVFSMVLTEANKRDSYREEWGIDPLEKADAPIFEELPYADTKWLTPKAATGSTFSYFGYYALVNRELPSPIIYKNCNIDVRSLLSELMEGMNARLVQSNETQWNEYYPKMTSFTIRFPQNPLYMIHVNNIVNGDINKYIIPDFISDKTGYFDNDLYLGQVTLMRPPDNSLELREKSIEESIDFYLHKCMLKVVPSKPEIYMVETYQQSFLLRSHAVKEDFEINDLNVNYGTGFGEFHNALMNRFKTEHKGLVLFHGLPGTGKTFYIRHLLREMAISNKRVIYMPPNMVEHLVDPGFMTFLSTIVEQYSSEGLFCVLLIEDAEPLLISRAADNRIQGITNLLNMTDGLLNDMLKLQIICTFNVELNQLDPALLRPGRLIARKEFKALPALDANLLAQRLGIKFNFRKPATLSEIYAKLKDSNTIIHEDY